VIQQGTDGTLLREEQSAADAMYQSNSVGENANWMLAAAVKMQWNAGRICDNRTSSEE
jgi:hypothetical protein